MSCSCTLAGRSPYRTHVLTASSREEGNRCFSRRRGKRSGIFLNKISLNATLWFSTKAIGEAQKQTSSSTRQFSLNARTHIFNRRRFSSKPVRYQKPQLQSAVGADRTPVVRLSCSEVASKKNHEFIQNRGKRYLLNKKDTLVLLILFAAQTKRQTCNSPSGLASGSSDPRRFCRLILRSSGGEIHQRRPRRHIGLRRIRVLAFGDLRRAEHAPVFRPR